MIVMWMILTSRDETVPVLSLVMSPDLLFPTVLQIILMLTLVCTVSMLCMLHVVFCFICMALSSCTRHTVLWLYRTHLIYLYHDDSCGILNGSMHALFVHLNRCSGASWIIIIHTVFQTCDVWVIAERLSARLLIVQCSRLAFVCVYICIYISVTL